MLSIIHCIYSKQNQVKDALPHNLTKGMKNQQHTQYF